MWRATFRRRQFLKKTTLGTAGFAIGGATMDGLARSESDQKLAILGGEPIRKDPFPAWPIIEARDEKAWLEVLRARHWFRGNGDMVSRFEGEFGRLMGSKECLATANGTSALLASLAALGIGPGDEVLVPPYTFVATVNVVLLHHALPVFVDTDLDTFQMDATKLEAAITEKTRCVIPVHLGGSAADLDTIRSLSKKHGLSVVEDACQAHLAEWRNRKVGTWGHTGCFSFQVSKNLSSGEGGAIVSDDSELMDRCYSFHTNGRARNRPSAGFAYVRNGANLRMTEFQGALLLQQMLRLDEQSRTREQNAEYLTRQLSEIPGIHPARQLPGCTRNAYHLYMFRYDPSHFSGVPRDRFLDALRAEGIPCSPGYSPLNQEPFLKEALHSRGFQAVYGRPRIEEYFKRISCPVNDRLCREAVWFTQPMLLGARSDMDQIAQAIRKIQSASSELSRQQSET
ncbi:MAG: DegT/DnrJ/EryC1/StrS family aminotransferase [Acidobacteriota bacterium]